MAGRSNPRHARRRRPGGPSAATVIGLLVCVVCFSAAFFLWKAALFGSGRNESGEEPFRPVVGDPPYRVCIDAGHGGSDRAQGVVEEKEMTAQTSEALLHCWRPTLITSRCVPAKAMMSPQSPASGQGPSMLPEPAAAAPSTATPRRRVLPRRALSLSVRPGRTWHQESYYSSSSWRRSAAAGAKLRATAAFGTFIIRV